MLGQVRLWYEATRACRASFSSIEGFCNTTLRKSSGTVVLARQYCFSKQEALCVELSSDSGRCTHIMQRSTEIQAFRSHIPDSYFSQKRQSEKRRISEKYKSSAREIPDSAYAELQRQSAACPPRKYRFRIPTAVHMHAGARNNVRVQ